MSAHTRFRHGDLHLAILALLRREPMHGYQLMGALRDVVGPHYRPSPGSIYPALAALESEGLLRWTLDGDRKVYELTAEGSAACERRADRLASLEARLGVRLGGGIDAAVARFAQRVRAAAVGLDESAVEVVLDDAATRIESMRRGGR
jgi:DNA-binding PadR family transcriptional regulator